MITFVLVLPYSVAISVETQEEPWTSHGLTSPSYGKELHVFDEKSQRNFDVVIKIWYSVKHWGYNTNNSLCASVFGAALENLDLCMAER